ncbi:cytochrome c3 family protein [Sphingorhabdus sp. Alg239-R122]|uniref:cytochrome c3 family protein n=1 Tax=Sphingorhabdus sp. Alg239-R122 TaxID=2305989 RepID=UPI0013DBDE7A|nr:cytochrome c3 family protein [Sphingorhabdus sp. Alg239-R122]
MSFIVRQIALKSDGSEIVRAENHVQDEILVGRSSENQIHLPDLAVNPVHASITRDDDGKVQVQSVSDLKFELNGRSVSKGTIDPARGGELRFGGHVIAVGKDAETSGIVCTVRRVEALSDSAEEKDQAKIYSLTGKLPSKRLSAWGFVILVLAACLAWPIYTWATYRGVEERPDKFHADTMWSSGKLSLAHQSLKDDCQACHVDAFVSVRDNACLTCHTEDAHEHAPTDRQLVSRGELKGFAKFRRNVAITFNKPPGRCVECHTEHEGAGAMQPTAQQFCAECHDGMDTRLTDTKLLNAADFGDSHPQFRPAVMTKPGGDNPPTRRISLDDNPTEDNGLKFPHNLHLSKTGGVAQMGRRLAGKYGFGASLECKDCHTPDNDNVRFQPVDMEKNCSMCHSLAFDEIGGTFRQLPHGKPDLVRADLRAYFRSTRPNRPINLGSRGNSNNPRRRPGDVNAARTASDYARAVRFRPTRAAQAIRAVFSRGGACYDCHGVTQPTSRSGLNYGIMPVSQTDRYMHKGWFSHKAHNDESCESCHVAATSGKASDLLLPGISTCRECHGGEASSSDVPSSCAMCHDYHADEGAPWLIRNQNKPKTISAPDKKAAPRGQTEKVARRQGGVRNDRSGG